MYNYINYDGTNTPSTQKSDNNRNDLYFQFDYDDNMSYKYILSIAYSWMGLLIYCNTHWILSETCDQDIQLLYNLA